MADWFIPEMDPDMHIETSEKGFTTNEITVKWLQHYIKYSDAGPNSQWKLLIIDNHGSHATPEFITLANYNHILPYPLIPHSSHFMQPCDVGLFGPYKHWHNVKLNKAVAKLDVEYHLKTFLKDLPWIRAQTFKKDTIRSAFRKSGIYPPSATACIKQLRTFTPPAKEKTKFNLPTTPVKADQVYNMLVGLENKILEPLSSATKPKVESLIKGTKVVFSYSQLQESKLQVMQERRTEEVQRKVNRRKVIQKYGGLTARAAQVLLAKKARKEAEELQRKQEREFKRLWNIEKKMKYTEGVMDRKAERERKKRVRELIQGGQDVPIELQVPIIDREKEWKEASQLQEEATRLAREAAIKEQEDNSDEEVTFILDTAGDMELIPELDQDFIGIPSSPPEPSQWWRAASIEAEVDSDLEVYYDVDSS
jgi:hypothetical protein